MFGVTYLSASDFSVFSYPRSPVNSPICLAFHHTAIERRFCTGQHPHECNDTEWDSLLARGAQLFVDVEEKMLDVCPRELGGLAICANEMDVCRRSDELTAGPTTKSAPGDIRKSGLDRLSHQCKDGLSSAHPSQLSTTASNARVDGDDGDLAQAFPTSQSPMDDFQMDGKRADGPSYGQHRPKRTSTRILDSARKQAANMPPREHIRRHSHCSSVTASLSTPTLSSSSSTTTTGDLSPPHSRDTSLSPSDASYDSDSADDAWKCPYCPWIQHTQRQPDFMRHQRSHFISRADWPCPNHKCGKSFARKDSLKRHLNNRARRCKRPPGYTVC